MKNKTNVWMIEMSKSKSINSIKKLKLIVLWVMANQKNLKKRETNKQIWKGA